MLTKKSIESIIPTNGKKLAVHDGHGLYLNIQRTKAGGWGRSWIFRYSFDGRQSQMGLGPYPAISIESARIARNEWEEVRRRGMNPKEEKHRRIADERSREPPGPLRLKKVKLTPPVGDPPSRKKMENAIERLAKARRSATDPEYVERRRRGQRLQRNYDRMMKAIGETLGRTK